MSWKILVMTSTSSKADLNLDLLGHFPAGVDPVTLECAEDAFGAAFIDPEPVFQGLNHLRVGLGIRSTAN